MARPCLVILIATAPLAAVPAAYRDVRSPSGKLGCTPRAGASACRSTRSGHGFSVSVERQRVF